MHIKLPYSQQSGRIPSPDRLKTGELWINGADAIIGTKNNENQVIQYAQLTPEQREHVLNDFVPREGLVNHVSVAQAATSIKGGTSDVTIAINDDSNTAIEYTVDCDRLIIDIAKTSGHKATKVVISKPAQKQVTIEWKGVDHWLSSIDVPTFGQSLEAQELCVAVFSSPSINCVNIIYNTEVLGSTDDEAVWGLIGGDITDQEDLQQALATKVDIAKHNSDMATKVSKSDYEADKASLFATKSELDVLEQSVVKISQNNTDSRGNIINNATDKAAYISMQADDSDRQSDLSTGTDKVSGNAWFRMCASNKAAPTATYNQDPEAKTRIEGALNTGIIIEQTGITKPLVIRSTGGEVSLTNNVGTLNVGDLQTLNAQALRKGGKVVLNGDLSGTCTLDGSETSTIKTTLANTAVKAGAYGQTTTATLQYGQSFTIPRFTVDAKGRLTNAEQYKITLPNEQTTITGNAGSATKLETARSIALSGTVTGTATNFDGTSNIVIKTTVDGSKVSGTVPAAVKSTQDGNGKVIATTYAPLINPTFVGTVTSPSFKGELSGNASTANKLAAARTITLAGDVTSTATSFDGSTNITITSSIPLMGAAAADRAGKKGLVPPPAANQHGYYLRGDGKWAVPTNTTYKAGGGLALSGTTFANSGVRSITAGSAANQLIVNTGGSNTTLTINNVANATAATKLATQRSINLSGAVVATARNFDGTANISIPVTEVKEAFLTWGGKNHAATFSPIDASMIPDLGANRLAFGKKEGIKVEYSRDGGKTWVNYPLADKDKLSLFADGKWVNVGYSNENQTTTDKLSAEYMLRITIETDKFGVYTTLNKFALLVSTSGSGGCYCTIDAAVKNTPTKWVTFANKVDIAGWSGWNVINTNSLVTYGNSPNDQYGFVRFTFGCTSIDPNYKKSGGLQVCRIMGFGGAGWETPSNMAKTGHIYQYDSLQNTTFPANVTATTFNGNLNGNAATASKAAALTNARTIAIGGAVTGTATSFNGTANITINTTAVNGSKVTGVVPAATKATQDGGGKVIATTYAPIANPTFTGTVTGTFKGNITGNVSGNASSATKATQDGNGKVIATTYAPLNNPTFTGVVTAPTFKGALTGNATSATKATQDGNGKVIATTYATNDSVNAVINLLRSRIEALEKIVDAGTI